MGNKALGLWDSSAARSGGIKPEVGGEREDKVLESENETKKEEESSSGSLDYKSAQGESFTDEDKYVMSSDKILFSSTQDSFLEDKQEVERKTEARISTNPEKVLEICYEDLLVDINHPWSLATDLLRRNVISSDTANAVLCDDLVKEEKVDLLINAVKKSIIQNPSAFNALLRSLEDHPSHRVVAARLKQVQDSLSAGAEVQPTSQSTSSVLQYARDLKSRYKTMLPDKQMDSREFKLLLKEDGIKSVKNRKLIYSSPAFTAIERRSMTMEPIECEKILTPDHKCILVEGASKTKLARYFAANWEEITQLKNYHLIVVLDLKKKHVQNINSLWDLFYLETVSFRQELLHEVNATKGKGILIILDSFENLPSTITKNHKSFYAKLVQGRILSKSTKLVTGTQQSIQSILGSYELSKFKHIELVKVPFKMLEGSELYSNSLDQPGARGISMPITELCTQFCLTQLNNYFAGLPLKTKLTKLQDLKDNPKAHKKVLFISKLAFKGIVDKAYNFDDSLDEDSTAHIGLMASLCTHCNNDVVEFDFLNQILQEFLAAYFISHLDDREQNEIFSLNSFVEFMGMWKFVAGLCGLTYTMLFSFKSRVSDPASLPAIVNIMYELHDEKAIKFVFEDYSVVNYSLFKSSESVSSASLYFELGYCIAASSCLWNLDFSHRRLEYEDFEALVSGIESSTGNGSVQILQLDFNDMTHDKVLLLSKLSLKNLKSLSMSFCNLTPKSMDSLASLMKCMPRLRSLNVSNNSMPCHNLVTQVLSMLSSVSSIRNLHLEGTALGYEDVVYLNTAMSMPSANLSVLSVGSKSMTSESSHLLIDTILSQSSIEVLRIFDLDLTCESSTLALLETNTNLTKIVFFECQLDISCLATSLCMNTVLREIEIFFPLTSGQCDITEDAAVALSDMIEVNCSLFSVSIYSYKKIEISKVLKMLEPMSYNQTLQTYHLPNHFSSKFTQTQRKLVDSRVHWNEWPRFSIE